MTIDEFRKIVEKKINENRILNSQIFECQEKVRESVRFLGCVKDAIKIIEGLALEKRNGIKTGVENIVSQALHVLYGEDYSFEMTYSEKNNRSCLDVYVLRKTQDGIVRRQMDGIGGGVSDCISIPLRMMILKGSKTGDILILDEAFKHIDKDQPELVGQFLKTIADTMGIQIIFSTHFERILDYADKGFLLKNVNGEVV